MKDERRKLYDALDACNDAHFATLLLAMQGINAVWALTMLEDPTPALTLHDAAKPFTDKLGTFA